MAGIGPPMLSEILNGNARPSWKTAKRLSSVVTGSTPEQWLEAPPETLRQLVSDFSSQQTMPPLAGRAPANEQGSSAMPCTVNL